MIKRSLAIAALLLILHGLNVKRRPMWSFSQTQWQDNVINAQHFIYQDRSKADSILVGSSLSCRLVKDSLPGIYNLSFGGGSIFDGLSILEKEKRSPKYLFIEMNVVIRGENKNFTGMLYSPLLNPLRKYFPQFRDEYQPVGIANNVIITHNIISRTLKRLKRLLHADTEEQPSRDALIKKIISEKTTEQAEELPVKLFAGQFSELKKYVSYFESHGTKIIFFEMPVDQELHQQPMEKYTVEGFYTNFPADKFTYIPLPGCSQYTTTDGSHLTNESAAKYSSYLRGRIDSVLN